MANHKGEILIELDRPRRLKYDVNALAEFEGVMGQSMPSLFTPQPGESSEEAGRRVGGFRVARALLWAGLLHENPRMKIEEAGRLIDNAPGESMEERVNFISAAIIKGFSVLRREDIGKKESIPEATASSGIGGTGLNSSE